MQGPGRSAARRARRFGDISRQQAAISRQIQGRDGHEIDHRDRCCRASGLLHQRLKCGLRRRRQDGPQRRRPELRLQRPGECFPRRALRRDPPAMWRKIFGKLLRRQDAVGDVSLERRGTPFQFFKRTSLWRHLRRSPAPSMRSDSANARIRAPSISASTGSPCSLQCAMTFPTTIAVLCSRDVRMEKIMASRFASDTDSGSVTSFHCKSLRIAGASPAGRSSG